MSNEFLTNLTQSDNNQKCELYANEKQRHTSKLNKNLPISNCSHSNPTALAVAAGVYLKGQVSGSSGSDLLGEVDNEDPPIPPRGRAWVEQKKERAQNTNTELRSRSSERNRGHFKTIQSKYLITGHCSSPLQKCPCCERPRKKVLVDLPAQRKYKVNIKP